MVHKRRSKYEKAPKKRRKLAHDANRGSVSRKIERMLRYNLCITGTYIYAFGEALRIGGCSSIFVIICWPLRGCVEISSDTMYFALIHVHSGSRKTLSTFTNVQSPTGEATRKDKIKIN